MRGIGLWEVFLCYDIHRSYVRIRLTKMCAGRCAVADFNHLRKCDIIVVSSTTLSLVELSSI